MDEGRRLQFYANQNQGAAEDLLEMRQDHDFEEAAGTPGIWV